MKTAIKEGTSRTASTPFRRLEQISSLEPFRPMQHMRSVEGQVRVLTTATFHLDEREILAFDVFYPKFEMLQARIGEEILEIEWADPSAPNRIVRRYYRKDAVDKIHQVYTLTFLLRTYEGEDLIREECESLNLSYYTYPHLRALFLLTGLDVVEEHGSFRKAALDNGAIEMIFLLQRQMSVKVPQPSDHNFSFNIQTHSKSGDSGS